MSIGSVLELLVLKNDAECTSQRLKWTSGARVTRSVARSLARSGARSIARSIGRSVARSINRSVARSLDRSLDRLLLRIQFRMGGDQETVDIITFGRAVYVLITKNNTILYYSQIYVSSDRLVILKCHRLEAVTIMLCRKTLFGRWINPYSEN